MNSDTAAGVNATIASIMVAALALYGAQVLGRVDALRRRIEASVDRVNSLGGYVEGDEKDPEAAENDSGAMRSRVNRFRTLAYGLDINSPGGWGSGYVPVRDLKSRGIDVQRMIRLLHGHYPFPTQLTARPNGELLRHTREQFVLTNAEKTSQWVRDVTELFDTVRFNVGNYASTLRELLEAVRPEGYPVATLDNSIFGRSPLLNPLFTHDEFFALPRPAEADRFVIDVFMLDVVAREISGLLLEKQGYIKGTRWRSMFIGLAALSLLAMTCGAVVPMLFPGASPFIYLWVPSLIYILAGIVGIGAAIASFRN